MSASFGLGSIFVGSTLLYHVMRGSKLANEGGCGGPPPENFSEDMPAFSGHIGILFT